MENVFEILKDLPKPGDYVLLTVAKGSAAGEKAILAEKKIIWESKENGFFSAHFSSMWLCSPNGFWIFLPLSIEQIRRIWLRSGPGKEPPVKWMNWTPW